MGQAIANANLRLVYGGGKVGLMGILADAVISAGGHVIGVMPRALVDREIAHEGLRDLRVVETMHERKNVMSALADSFVALPGGAGTLEEIFEQWTWSQLGIHAKPCGFLNVNGYFSELLAMIRRMVTDGFLAEQFAAMLNIDTDPDRLLARFRTYHAPTQKWAAENNQLKQPNDSFPSGNGPRIRIATAVIINQEGRVLLVRKRGALFFMQPGGKLEEGETAQETLARELNEELGCTLLNAVPLGVFTAEAANEPGETVEAAVFRVEIEGDIKPRAEIEELSWIYPNDHTVRVAPLTRLHVLPLIISWNLKGPDLNGAALSSADDSFLEISRGEHMKDPAI